MATAPNLSGFAAALPGAGRSGAGGLSGLTRQRQRARENTLAFDRQLELKKLDRQYDKEQKQIGMTVSSQRKAADGYIGEAQVSIDQGSPEKAGVLLRNVYELKELRNLFGPAESERIVAIIEAKLANFQTSEEKFEAQKKKLNDIHRLHTDSELRAQASEIAAVQAEDELKLAKNPSVIGLVEHKREQDMKTLDQELGLRSESQLRLADTAQVKLSTRDFHGSFPKYTSVMSALHLAGESDIYDPATGQISGDPRKRDLARLRSENKANALSAFSTPMIVKLYSDYMVIGTPEEIQAKHQEQKILNQILTGAIKPDTEWLQEALRRMKAGEVHVGLNPDKSDIFIKTNNGNPSPFYYPLLFWAIDKGEISGPDGPNKILTGDQAVFDEDTQTVGKRTVSAVLEFLSKGNRSTPYARQNVAVGLSKGQTGEDYMKKMAPEIKYPEGYNEF